MQPKWKKVLFLCTVVFLLVLSFWYGGDNDSLHGFSLENRSETGVDLGSVEQQTEFLDEKENRDVREKEPEKTNFFTQIVMNIKQVGSSSGTKKNAQFDKKAQKNANKAVQKAEKESSKKSKKKKKVKTADRDLERSNEPDDKEKNTQNNTTEAEGTVPEEDRKQDTPGTESTTATEEEKGVVNCKISISCETVLGQMDSLKAAKRKVVPKDGIMLRETSVKVVDNSTVFDVLKKVAGSNKIALEYSFTPMTKSYYIEGIGNLYEFDAGDLSGWMYSVNGEFTGMGCSSFRVSEGDVIQWVYTCNLGKDVGGYFEDAVK